MGVGEVPGFGPGAPGLGFGSGSGEGLIGVFGLGSGSGVGLKGGGSGTGGAGAGVLPPLPLSWLASATPPATSATPPSKASGVMVDALSASIVPAPAISSASICSGTLATG